jgi:MFS family permease
MNLPPPRTPPPLPNALRIEPMPNDTSPAAVLESLLKHPGRIIHELRHERAVTVSLWLLVLGLVGMALYGLVVGALSGGQQLLFAPAKMTLGTLLAMLICLPSLYIFACLDGVEAPIRTIAGTMFAAVCLSALLLIGFAPVSWIFSQSTDSTVLMGILHLLFWAVGITFGLRLLNQAAGVLDDTAVVPPRGRRHLRIWNLIFVVVCLQMTTALRPIIGTSETFLPREKKFFVAHWLDSMNAPAQEVNP